MRFRRQILPNVLLALALAAPVLQADPADVAGSRDYPGFPRIAGFILTDYDEDNPADFDFPVSRPLPIDADHLEMVHVRGHRYVIRYEMGPQGRGPSLLQMQLYFEKLAAKSGFAVEKTGAVADGSETFRQSKSGHEIWTYLEPAITSYVLTVVESNGVAEPAAATSPAATMNVPERVRPPIVPPPAPLATTRPAPAPAPAPPVPGDGESLYRALSQEGRVVVPLNFMPGKQDLDGASQPVIDRIVAMMKMHPDLFLRIESHTDNSGDSEENLRLSSQRAYAVRQRLIAAQIEPKRLDAVGVGGLQPIASNDTPQGREKNRRIELVVRKKFPASHTVAPRAQDSRDLGKECSFVRMKNDLVPAYRAS